MQLALSTIFAALLLAIAVYAHVHIPRFTAGNPKAALSHAVLLLVGLAAGGVGAVIYRGEPVLALLSLLVGFGVVHVPAAIILFFKQQRHSGKT